MKEPLIGRQVCWPQNFVLSRSNERICIEWMFGRSKMIILVTVSLLAALRTASQVHNIFRDFR
jgi:hypothetical protein